MDAFRQIAGYCDQRMDVLLPREGPRALAQGIVGARGLGTVAINGRANYGLQCRYLLECFGRDTDQDRI